MDKVTKREIDYNVNNFSSTHFSSFLFLLGFIKTQSEKQLHLVENLRSTEHYKEVGRNILIISPQREHLLSSLI